MELNYTNMPQMKVLFIYLGIAFQKNSNRIYYFD